ncbi:hypothetical protein [Bacillus gobiensis]
MRFVAISDLDEQACGGTHVKSTKEIGAFSINKIKNKGPHIKRIGITITD